MRPLAVTLAVWHVESQVDRSYKFLRYCTSVYEEVVKFYIVFVILICSIDIYILRSRAHPLRLISLILSLTDDSRLIAKMILSQ